MDGCDSQMNNRAERRRQLAEVKRKLRDPIVRRLVDDEVRRGGVTEVYRLDGSDIDEPIYFNVSAMREWADGCCEIIAMPVDFERAERLLESGAIDMDRIANHTIRNNPKPIIVCRGLRGEDQIVDGAHTFIAICMASKYSGLPLPVPSYVLLPDQWKRFIISKHVVEMTGMSDG